MKRHNPSFRPQFLSLAVVVTFITIIICYALRPKLLNPRIAFSKLGAYPPTSLIFSIGFILASLLLVADGVKTKNLFQRICRLVAAVGFFMLGAFRIEHGPRLSDLHRLGGIIMLVAVVVSMIGHVWMEWSTSSVKRRMLYLFFVGLALASFTLSVLSSAQFAVFALEGLAQYLGLVSLIGWAVLDKNEPHGAHF